MIHKRLKQLRLANSLTLDDLSARIGRIVSKQALQKYEKGTAKPSIIVQSRLAEVFGLKTAQLWSEPSIKCEFIAYRKRSGLGKRKQEQIENLVSTLIEERIYLQELIQQKMDWDVPIKEIQINSIEDVESAAEQIRQKFTLGSDPITSVTDILENHFIHIIKIKADLKFDGISAVAYNEYEEAIAAAIVTRLEVPGDRERLNISHELGHLVLNIPKGIDENKAVFRFGAAFLAPAIEMYRIAGRKRNQLPFQELFELKQYWGMSIQALLRRFFDLGIITHSHYQKKYRDLSRMGWRIKEPIEIPNERPQWLSRSVLRALAEGLITQSEGEKMLRKKIEIDEPSSLVERRAFLGLPIEERRRILSEQAKAMEEEYKKLNQTPEWEAWQGGDIIDD